MNAVIRGVSDYSKCIWKNRFTLAGYALTPVAFILGFLYFNQWPHLALLVLFTVTMMLAAFLLTATFFGLQTLFYYRRAKRIFEKRGNVSLPRGKDYCSRAGIQMAIEENNQLPKAS